MTALLPVFGQVSRARAVASGMGLSGGAAIPGTAAFSAGPALTPSTSLARNVGRTITDTAARAPRGFTAGEMGASLGAGQGAVLAELAAPGDPNAAMLGEIAGGILNPAGIVYSLARSSGGAVGRAVTPFTTGS